MRSIDTWLDRFCYKHPRLGIPDLMKYVVIGNIVVYLLDMFSGYACSAMLAFIPAGILQGQIWRLVSFIFVPPTGYGAIGLALFLYMYYMIGNMLEREWGTTKFTLYYGIGVAANIVVGLVLTLIYGPNHPYAVVDITYLNMSLFLAFAALYPDLRFLLFFIILQLCQAPVVGADIEAGQLKLLLAGAVQQVKAPVRIQLFPQLCQMGLPCQLSQHLFRCHLPTVLQITHLLLHPDLIPLSGTEQAEGFPHHIHRTFLSLVVPILFIVLCELLPADKFCTFFCAAGLMDFVPESRYYKY